MTNDPRSKKKIHAKLSAKGVTPSSKIEGEENGEKGGHHILVNIELSNLKTGIEIAEKLRHNLFVFAVNKPTTENSNPKIE